MTVPEWLRALTARGVELWFEGDRLRFRAPRGTLGAEERSELSARREEIVAHLRAEASSTESIYPLSFSQQSLWFLHQQAPWSTAYHVAMSVRVLSPVGVGALRQAVQALVDRHGSLRTAYVIVDGMPRQRVAGARAVELELRSAAGLGETELRAALEADYRRPFDLEHDPVLRASLFTRGPSDHVLLITVHHIAADGWSLMLLFEELLKLYAEATGGPAASLSRPLLEYTDYAAWQEQTLAGPEGERLWAYWRDQLAAPRARLELPADRPRPEIQSFRGASLPLELGADLTGCVKELARSEGTTPFVVLLASFQAFLYRLTRREDVFVGTPVFARSKAEFMQVVGDFVNSVALRGKLTAAMTFRELVAQLRGTVLDALEAQELPFPLLVRRLQPERDPSRSPLFDAFFTLQRFEHFKDLQGLLAGGGAGSVVDMGSLRLAPFPLDQQEGQFDLALQMVESGGVLRGVLKYGSDLFEEATIRRFAECYRALVEAAVREPGRALGALPELSAVENRENGATLLGRLRERDIRLFLEEDRLRVNAPRGALNDELKALIAAHRDELVAALRSAAGRGAEVGGALRRISRDGPLPLSSTQQRLWLLDRVEPGRSHPNVSAALRLSGPLDAAVVRRALDELVHRHESLRTRIGEEDGVPYPEIPEPTGAALEVVDLSQLAGEARVTAARAARDELMRLPFELGRGPLVRFLLVRVEPEVHILSVSAHQVVSDGWSTVIFLRELCELYRAFAAGRPPGLAPLPLQYVDYAGWERDQLRSGRLVPQLAYWKAELADAPALLELPTDRPRPSVRSFRGRNVFRRFDADLVRAVKQLGAERQATLYMTLLAAFQVLLHRYSGQDDVLVGSPIANRDDPQLEGVIGCFVDNLVMRGRLAGNPTFTEFLVQVEQTVLRAFDHRHLPFDLLVDGLRTDRSVGHTPIFQALFALHSFPRDLGGLPGIGVELVAEAAQSGAARFDVALDVTECRGELFANYEYATDLFEESTVARMHDHLERLLRAVVADPHCRVQDLPLLSPQDERLLLGKWNDTSLEHDRGRCLHHLLEGAARATPEATAVVAEGSSYSYRAVDERANQLAHLLARHGVAPGALVAVCVDRTWDMPVAIAAVLKAGAAYVPLDPSHPPDRLRYTLEDAGVACTVTLQRFAPLLGAPKAPLVLLDEVEDQLASLPATPPEVRVRPEDRAYVIYTSGSTGRPKGVEVEHRNVVSFLEAMRRTPGFSPDDVLLAVTTLSFDIAGLELWLPLGMGARVVIASRADVLDGERLASMLEEYGVTVMQATPATWRLMLEAGWSGRRELKALCGGEALPRDLAVTLAGRVGALWNMYGPTETTIWSTVCRIDDAAGPITIGRPIHNTRVYVLERSGQPAPIGVLGELCIGGEGVARGYHDRPELTAERFVTIRLPGGAAERVYRTGDVARILGDGRIEFLGRRDHQVKVRGYRIELGEIEAVLAEHPGVQQCVVAVREDRPGEQRLVGYVVEAEGTRFEADPARAMLRAKLPEYMVPGFFMVLEALPLTPNGKIDRKALPAPQASAAPVAAQSAEDLMSPVQRRVATCWREVLRDGHFGPDDNFFDVGGHSLLLVRLHAALRREFATDLQLVELFQWTTVTAQAARLSASPTSDSALRRAQARAARQTHA